MLIPFFFSGITTSDVTAESSVDYTPETRTIIFDKGESSFTFTIPVTQDNIVEETESFEIRFSNIVGGEIGHPATAYVVIENEDCKNACLYTFHMSTCVKVTH